MINLLEESLKIRVFERKLLKLFSENLVGGTTHTCIGQEISGVCVGQNLNDGDIVFSNHRCHGHYLGLTRDYFGLGAEILGLDIGINQGYSGSQHINIPNKFYSNGILGGMVAFSVGAAYNLKNNIAVVFIGDGAFGEGSIYEAVNISKYLSTPNLFFIEDNQISQSTFTTNVNKVDISNFFKTFGIESITIDDENIGIFNEIVKEQIKLIRQNKLPRAIIWKCKRHSAHSKGDDSRSEQEINEIIKNDYLKKLYQEFEISYEDKEKEYTKTIDELFDKLLIHKTNSQNNLSKKYNFTQNKKNYKVTKLNLTAKETLSKKINLIIRKLIEDYDILFIGEDVEDNYGGAFKISKGLSNSFPKNVFNMPISESAIVGFSSGLSIKRKFSICEIMFGDFITLTADQIINHSAKFSYSNESHKPSIIIRTPIGGGRGYGSTHSQNLEKIFGGIPGIKIENLSFLHDIDYCYKNSINNNGCTIISEPKTQYGMRSIDINFRIKDLWEIKSLRDNDGQEIIFFKFKENNPDLTIISTGVNLTHILESIDELFFDKELCINVIIPRRIYPLDLFTNNTEMYSSNLLIIDESHEGYGFIETASSMLYKKFPNLKIDSLFLKFPYYPASRELEAQMIINKNSIINKVSEIL